jgi:hypothetical protein
MIRNARQFNFNDATGAYLTFAGLQTSDLKHGIHIELLKDPSFQQTYFHIILDMCKDSAVNLDINTLRHEIKPPFPKYLLHLTAPPPCTFSTTVYGISWEAVGVGG